jgi:hypothetical protein
VRILLLLLKIELKTERTGSICIAGLLSIV